MYGHIETISKNPPCENSHREDELFYGRSFYFVLF